MSLPVSDLILSLAPGQCAAPFKKWWKISWRKWSLPANSSDEIQSCLTAKPACVWNDRSMYFFLAFFISLTVTPGVIWLMRRLRVIDLPKTEARKIHKKKVPLGGGLAIIIAFFACIAMAFFVFHDIGKEVPARAIIGFTLGSLVLVVGGFLDDRFRLRPLRQVIFPVVASLVAIFFGIGLKTVTNPAGGVIHLDQIVIIADLVVFFWLM